MGDEYDDIGELCFKKAHLGSLPKANERGNKSEEAGKISLFVAEQGVEAGWVAQQGLACTHREIGGVFTSSRKKLLEYKALLYH